jgi:hypothetical protein
MAQALPVVSWAQRTPAGLLMPLTRGMPGMGEEMEGAMQQAPQPDRQFMGEDYSALKPRVAAVLLSSE